VEKRGERSARQKHVMGGLSKSSGGETGGSDKSIRRKNDAAKGRGKTHPASSIRSPRSVLDIKQLRLPEHSLVS